MALYQSTEILAETMMKGSFKVEYAPMVADYTTGVYVEVGLCDDPSFTEEVTMLEGSASNGAKPSINTGIASQKASISFAPWSFDPTNYMALRGGIDTLVTNATGTEAGQRSVFTGGLTNITPVMLRFTNRRDDVAKAADVALYTGLTGLSVGDAIYRDTSFTFFKTTISGGTNITGKRDDDADAALRFPFTMEAVEDTSLDAGRQLFVTDYKISLIP